MNSPSLLKTNLFIETAFILEYWSLISFGSKKNSFFWISRIKYLYFIVFPSGEIKEYTHKIFNPSKESHSRVLNSKPSISKLTILSFS